MRPFRDRVRNRTDSVTTPTRRAFNDRYSHMLEAGPRGRGSVPCVLARSWLRRPCRAVCWLRGVYSLALRGAGVGSRVGPKRQRRRPGRAAIRGRAGLVGDVRCRDPRLPLYPAVPTSRDTGHLRSPPALRLGTRNAERVRSGARHVASVCAADCACAPRHSGDTGLCTMARCPRARQRDTGTARDYFGRARTTECARMLALAVPQPKGPDARHFGSSTFSPRSYASRVARSESTS